jgi:hypothetical protein
MYRSVKYRATPDFWYSYRQLPNEIQNLAIAATNATIASISITPSQKSGTFLVSANWFTLPRISY